MKRRWTFSPLIAAGLLIVGCEAPEVDDAGGDRAQVDSLLDAYVYAWENEDTDTLDAILAPGFTRTENDDEGLDVDSLKQVIGGASPLQNLNVDLGDVIVGDGIAAASWTVTASLGDQTVEFNGASFFEISNGKLASENVYTDTARLMMMMQGMSSDTTDTTASM